MREAEWSVFSLGEADWCRFCARLLRYIDDYCSFFIETDYEIDLDMTRNEVVRELQSVESIDDFSPQLKKVAQQLKESLIKENTTGQ